MSAPNPTNLDFPQVLRGAFDETTGRLRTDSIATIANVSIAVDLDPSNDGVYVADKDSGNKLKVNTDGSINVVVQNNGSPQVDKNIFNEQLAVASGATVNLVTYTVPSGKTASLQRIFTSGENIAKYEVLVNGIKIDCARTYFGSALNINLDYRSDSGLILVASDNLVVTVIHNRPSVGDFQGRIQIVEIG